MTCKWALAFEVSLWNNFQVHTEFSLSIFEIFYSEMRKKLSNYIELYSVVVSWASHPAWSLIKFIKSYLKTLENPSNNGTWHAMEFGETPVSMNTFFPRKCTSLFLIYKFKHLADIYLSTKFGFNWLRRTWEKFSLRDQIWINLISNL